MNAGDQLGDLGPVIGNVRALGGWLRRGPDTAADRTAPRYDQQWNTVDTGGEQILRSYRGHTEFRGDGARNALRAGAANIHETDTAWLIDTPQALPAVPLGGPVRLLQRALGAALPPEEPRRYAKTDVDVSTNRRGDLVITPRDEPGRAVVAQTRMSVQRPLDQSAGEQLRNLREMFAYRRRYR